jgi:Protein of unknown function (DUF1348)
MTASHPPLPPFTLETAIQKVRIAEDAWNTRDPHRGQEEDRPKTGESVSGYAWNAYREGKTITSVKYDTKKGLHTVAE